MRTPPYTSFVITLPDLLKKLQYWPKSGEERNVKAQRGVVWRGVVWYGVHGMPSMYFPFHSHRLPLIISKFKGLECFGAARPG